MKTRTSSLTPNQGDLLMGGLLLLFSLFFYIMTYNFAGYEIDRVEHDIGPAILPRLLLIVMALESLILTVSAVSRGIQSTPESVRLDAVFQRRPIIMLGTFLGYLYLTTFFGYIISTLLFIPLAFYLLGVRGLGNLLLVPPLITATTYFLFGTVLNIYLPSGNLF